jgi:hypothetical protein
MGCGLFKSSQKVPSRADIAVLETYPEELQSKRMKILQWMKDDPGRKIKHRHAKVIREELAAPGWHEAWRREQELVAHPSRIDSYDSKILCLTLLNDDLRVLCPEELSRTDQSTIDGEFAAFEQASSDN